MTFYKKIVTKKQNFRKIAIYQILSDPDWKKKPDPDRNILKLKFYKNTVVYFE